MSRSKRLGRSRGQKTGAHLIRLNSCNEIRRCPSVRRSPYVCSDASNVETPRASRVHLSPLREDAPIHTPANVEL